MSTVHIPADNVEPDGELILPPSANGVVLFDLLTQRLLAADIPTSLEKSHCVA